MRSPDVQERRWRDMKDKAAITAGLLFIAPALLVSLRMLKTDIAINGDAEFEFGPALDRGEGRKRSHDKWQGTVADKQTGHLTIYPFGYSSPRDLLIKDTPQGTVVKVGKDVYKRHGSGGPFASLKRLDSTHIVAEATEHIRVGNVIVDIAYTKTARH